jgi:hypothetical protein
MISEKLNTKSRINRRLSITVSAVIQVKNMEIMERDHTHPDARDDTGQFAEQPATSL